MTDGSETASTEAATASDRPVAPPGASTWTPGPPTQGSAAAIADEHPELIVGGAFAGGLLLATILKRLAG
jgi:hypothetical protein